MNEQILSMFRLGKNVSKMSLHRTQMGSVIVIKNHPVSVGCNQRKSHPDAWHSGLHAEIQAIKNSDVKDFRGASIFVYRQDKNGNLAMARPCKYCYAELKKLGFKWMYFTTKEYPFFNVEKIK